MRILPLIGVVKGRKSYSKPNTSVTVNFRSMS
jgi:hypothetical protein